MNLLLITNRQLSLDPGHFDIALHDRLFRCCNSSQFPIHILLIRIDHLLHVLQCTASSVVLCAAGPPGALSLGLRPRARLPLLHPLQALAHVVKGVTVGHRATDPVPPHADTIREVISPAALGRLINAERHGGVQVPRGEVRVVVELEDFQVPPVNLTPHKDVPLGGGRSGGIGAGSNGADNPFSLLPFLAGGPKAGDLPLQGGLHGIVLVPWSFPALAAGILSPAEDAALRIQHHGVVGARGDLHHPAGLGHGEQIQGERVQLLLL
mmetsp:Transcript_47880/g.126931  ORF Transcript_47880/g.126931 Transcript_47880/m.126931 type:complete len:267 (-) Transcript_47880:168-968(-)